MTVRFPAGPSHRVRRHIMVALTLGMTGAMSACSSSSLIPPPPIPTPSPPSTSSADPSPSPGAALSSISATAPGGAPTLSQATPQATDQIPRTEVVPIVTPVAERSAPTSAPQPSATLQAATSQPPSEPPSPTPLTPAEPGVSVNEGQITLPTYPYRNFLREEHDALYGMMVPHLDRAAYEASAPAPSPQTYRTLVIENSYLRLTFLPELGGRLYSAVVKSTGQEVFYHNPVVKPSRYGPLLPIEDNWWLAVGGMEWAFPVPEHGYAWGLPWTYQITSTDQGVTVTLRDSTELGRVRAEVQVTLPAHSGVISIRPRLVNATNHTVPVQFWVNGVLAPGSPSIPLDLRISIPVNQVVVHSRGETGWDVPGPGLAMPWPLVTNRDLSQYGQWANHLGFFIPYMPATFMAIYNPGADLGIARIISPGQIAGHKVFAFGPNFSDRSYTDDGSQYIEMWGGANSGFWPENDLQLAPGGTVEWQEEWWPLAGLGGLVFANDHVAFNMLGSSTLRILGARPGQVTLVLSAGEDELLRTSLALDPAQPIELPLPAALETPLRIQFYGPSGDLIADYLTSQHTASNPQ